MKLSFEKKNPDIFLAPNRTTQSKCGEHQNFPLTFLVMKKKTHLNLLQVICRFRNSAKFGIKKTFTGGRQTFM
jgi:hypothetical protein